MYPPAHHQTQNFEHAIQTIKAYPLATLVSSTKDDCHCTHVPLIHYADGTTFGKLVGHIDRLNPQVPWLEKQTITAIFHGPDTYISPTAYHSSKLLPTWNYVKVHIKATAKLITDPDYIKNSIIQMTDILEYSDQPFQLHPDDPRMEHLLPHIIGFELQITDWEGKFKLSQDKRSLDQLQARTTLLQRAAIQHEGFLDTVFPLKS